MRLVSYSWALPRPNLRLRTRVILGRGHEGTSYGGPLRESRERACPRSAQNSRPVFAHLLRIALTIAVCAHLPRVRFPVATDGGWLLLACVVADARFGRVVKDRARVVSRGVNHTRLVNVCQLQIWSRVESGDGNSIILRSYQSFFVVINHSS